jgi:hypothetical protein
VAESFFPAMLSLLQIPSTPFPMPLKSELTFLKYSEQLRLNLEGKTLSFFMVLEASQHFRDRRHLVLEFSLLLSNDMYFYLSPHPSGSFFLPIYI